MGLKLYLSICTILATIAIFRRKTLGLVLQCGLAFGRQDECIIVALVRCHMNVNLSSDWLLFCFGLGHPNLITIPNYLLK